MKKDKRNKWKETSGKKQVKRNKWKETSEKKQVERNKWKVPRKKTQGKREKETRGEINIEKKQVNKTQVDREKNCNDNTI